jgi:hypothetical protein
MRAMLRRIQTATDKHDGLLYAALVPPTGEVPPALRRLLEAGWCAPCLVPLRGETVWSNGICITKPGREALARRSRRRV